MKRTVNVEKGKQGFQETRKSPPTVGLDGIAVDTNEPIEYMQPLTFIGAPAEGTRFDVVSATAYNEANTADNLRKVLRHISPENAWTHFQEINASWNEGAETANRAVSAAMTENMTAQRKRDFLAISPGWTEPSITYDGGYEVTTGCEYDANRDVTETAKLVRHDLAAAIKSGFIPEGNYSVRTQRYAGGRSLDIEAIVQGDPGDFHNRDVIGYDDRQIAWQEMTSRLNMIPQQYAQNRTAQGLSEGGNSNFHRHVIIGFSG